MTHHRAIDEARTLPTDEVTLVVLQRWIEALGDAINAPPDLRPTFGRSDGFARPHITLGDGAIAYVIEERGTEISRDESTSALEILALVFLDATFSMASSWQARHPHPTDDPRRRLFARQLFLLDLLFPPWAQRQVDELAHRLDEVGLNPNDAQGLIVLTEHPPRVKHPRRFRIYNAAQKARRASDALGLGEEESVIAAAMTFPLGHKRSTALRMGAGGVAIMSQDAAATSGLAARMPGGQHFLIVTSSRLLATTVSTVSTNPKQVIAEWPLEKVAAIGANPGWAAATIEVRFRDGTRFEVDGARSSGAEEFQELFGT